MLLSLITVLSAAVLVGCDMSTWKHEVDVTLPPERATAIEKLPLTVGVFYDPRFRDYAHAWSPRATWAEQMRREGNPIYRHANLPITTNKPGANAAAETVIKNFGQLSVALFDRVMHALFARVERVKVRRPAFAKSSALAAIIEPELVEYRPTEMDALTNMDGRCTTITYRLILRTAVGKELARWPVSAKSCAAFADIGFAGPATQAQKSLEAALKAVEAKVLVGFAAQPEVRRWLAHRGVAPAGRGKNNK